MSKNVWADLEATLENRQKYPADMGFQPLSDKFGNQPIGKAPWLKQYLQFRLLNEGVADSRTSCLQYLQQNEVDCSERADRSRGALLGLALGDSLGMPLEFMARDEVQVRGLEAGGPFKLEKGQWTDDTSMACCLAYSLIHCAGFNPMHVMKCFSDWYRFGAYSVNGRCFDIGATTREALDHFLSTAEPYAGSSDPRAAGNGSLMRLAPMAVFYFESLQKTVEFSALSSMTTHRATEAVDACRYFGALLYGALHGESKETLLNGIYSPTPDFWSRAPLAPRIEHIALGSYKHKPRSDISSSGYVVDSLEAALWAFFHFDTFEESLLAAVNLAGDSDTVGAICGQLAGAHYGEARLPIQWLKHLHGVQGFYHFAEDLINASSGLGGSSET